MRAANEAFAGTDSGLCHLPPGQRPADIEIVTPVVERHLGWWDWRVSSHFRVGSLGSLWALLLLSPVLGPLLAPLAAGRFGLSTLQLILNRSLGQRHPIKLRSRFDWVLLVVAFLGSCFASAAQGTAPAVLLLMPVAIPYSAIQVRACVRSYRADAVTAARNSPRILELPDLVQAA